MGDGSYCFGIGAALNAGIRASRGTYLARLDSDDVWLPCMLQVALDVLESNAEVGLVYGRAQAMDAAGCPSNEFRGYPLWFPDDAFRSMLYGDVTCNIALVVRRKCLEDVGLFDESFVVHED